eukprot:6269629-Amphidinium_carterae.1
MHDCILMHENQGLKALFEESAPPILVHGRTRRLHAAAQHLEVSSYSDGMCYSNMQLIHKLVS